VKPFRIWVVIAFVFQSFSLPGVCLPLASCGSDCCVPSQESSETSPGPLPDCCVPSVLRAHASVAEVQGKQVPGRPLIAIVPLEQPEFRLWAEMARVAVLPLRQAIPPPLSPRLQTCLLLI